MSHHCFHYDSVQDDPDLGDVACCVCCKSPCGRPDVEFVMNHESFEISAVAKRYVQEIEYVLAHGKRMEAPF